MTTILTLAPWLLLLAGLPLLVARRPALSRHPARVDGDPRRVSVVLVTRDDAPRVGACLATLLDTDYPSLEVVVVDAGSTDGTREIVSALESRSPAEVRLVEAGASLSHEAAAVLGARSARGELLLFTDPACYHDPALLGRAVNALEAERADLLVAVPRLALEGFWERLVMPHVWLMLAARLPSPGFANRRQATSGVAAHLGFILVRRSSYDRVDGDGALSGPADGWPALARAVRAAGGRLHFADSRGELETRRNRSLGGIEAEVRAMVPAGGGPVGRGGLRLGLSLAVIAAHALLFVLPPIVLVARALLLVRGPVVAWAMAATALSGLYWLLVYAHHRVRPAYAVAFPIGALTGCLLLAVGVLRGRRAARRRRQT